MEYVTMVTFRSRARHTRRFPPQEQAGHIVLHDSPDGHREEHRWKRRAQGRVRFGSGHDG